MSCCSSVFVAAKQARQQQCRSVCAGLLFTKQLDCHLHRLCTQSNDKSSPPRPLLASEAHRPSKAQSPFGPLALQTPTVISQAGLGLVLRMENEDRGSCGTQSCLHPSSCNESLLFCTDQQGRILSTSCLTAYPPAVFIRPLRCYPCLDHGVSPRFSELTSNMSTFMITPTIQPARRSYSPWLHLHYNYTVYTHRSNKVLPSLHLRIGGVAPTTYICACLPHLRGGMYRHRENLRRPVIRSQPCTAK